MQLNFDYLESRLPLSGTDDTWGGDGESGSWGDPVPTPSNIEWIPIYDENGNRINPEQYREDFLMDEAEDIIYESIDNDMDEMLNKSMDEFLQEYENSHWYDGIIDVIESYVEDYYEVVSDPAFQIPY